MDPTPTKHHPISSQQAAVTTQRSGRWEHVTLSRRSSSIRVWSSICLSIFYSLKSKYLHVRDRSFLTSLFYPRSTGRDKISLVGSMKQMRCYFNPEFHSNQGIIQDDDDIMSWWCLSWHDINDKLITTYHLIEHHGHTLTPLCSHLRFIFRVTLQYDFPLSQNKYLDNIVTKPSWIGLKM